MWQLAYSEFYFTDVPWPDFTKEELVKAIEEYNHRHRRFGGVEERKVYVQNKTVKRNPFDDHCACDSDQSGDLLFFVLLIISLIGMTELYKVFGIEKKPPGALGYIAAIVYYGLLYFEQQLPGDKMTWFMMLFMAFLICEMATLVFAYPKYNTQQIFAAFFGLFYVTVMLSYIYQTRLLEGGIFTVWLVFVCSWGCDTCAYCVGMLIGKHKMAPVLSPKKSIEGGIGGILGAALIGVLYALAINHWGGAESEVFTYAVIGAVGGAISQIGDLAASAIKRYHNIKDYGRLIPGHGGILDRFDSVIFTAPIIYYLAILL